MGCPEDADEFRPRNIDAKQEVGRGLSRLLNVVDVLLGQALRLLVLITTNEPIARLHPAVTRPGRSAATIEFRPLSADEVGAWLHDRGSDSVISESTTFAELYSILTGRQPVPVARQRVGFQ